MKVIILKIPQLTYYIFLVVIYACHIFMVRKNPTVQACATIQLFPVQCSETLHQ
jgi:hypothetical protein